MNTSSSWNLCLNVSPIICLLGNIILIVIDANSNETLGETLCDDLLLQNNIDI